MKTYYSTREDFITNKMLVFKGMTVNERLYMRDLIDDFDKAVEEKDIDLVRLILKKIEITDESLIIPILKQLGL